MTAPDNALSPTRFRDLAEQGYRLFPLKPRSKKPAVRSWKTYIYRDPTPDELAAWDASNYNVAIITGTPSGLIALDVDDPEAQQTVDLLDLPETPISKTSRGQHYLFRLPAGGIGNAVKIGGHKLDVRGEGGYIVGPGSQHPDGSWYCWEVSPTEVPHADWPDVLGDLMASARSQRRSKPAGAASAPRVAGGRFAKYLDDRLSEALDTVRSADEGQRNDLLFKAAVALANDVAGAGEDWEPFARCIRDAAIAIGLPDYETAKTVESAWESGSSRPTMWMSLGRSHIYLTALDRIMHLQSGALMKVNAFNNTYAAHAVGRASLAAYLFANDYMEIVHDRDYKPTIPERFIPRDGLKFINTYRAPDIVSTPGDPKPFVEFLEYLMPIPEEREHLVRVIAFSVLRPGIKIRHGIVIRSKAQGIGKGLLAIIWSRQIGEHNARRTSTEELTGSFNGFIPENLLLVVEEMNLGFGRSIYNRIKAWITEDTVNVNEKGLPVREWPNYATWLMFSNLETPILIEDGDRRFAYFDSPAEPRPDEYYADFAEWCETNPGVIRHYLEGIDLSGFNPNARPPMTSAKQQLIANGRTDLVRELQDEINGREGVFAKDLVTLAEVELNRPGFPGGSYL